MPPAHPSSRPCGRNPRRRRARPAASDRLRWTDAEPLSCVAQPGKRIVAVELPGTRRARVVREVVREVVRCIRPIARAGSTACGFRPSLVDGRGAFVVRRAAGTGIVAGEPPGTRRARVVREVVRCIRPIARAGSAPCGFRPSSMDGRGAFVVRRAAGEEDHRSGTARNAPGAGGT